MGRQSAKGKIAKEYLAEFPNASRKAIARKLYADHPEVYDSVEQARTLIRYYTGSCGPKNRKKIEDRFLREPSKSGEGSFPKLPEAVELSDTSPVPIEGNKTLVISDVHIPYHDVDALKITLEYGVQNKCDSLVILGDLVDYYALSRWITDPRERDLNYEIKATIQTLYAIRELFPTQKIYYKLGNHEERWDSYLFVRAPELVGVDAYERRKTFGLDDLDIKLVDRMQHLQSGSISLVHGHEFGRTIWNPVNPARGLFLRAKASAMCGHYHQTSEHIESNMNGKIIGCWSIGCLCDMKPRYSPYPRWNHGFAMIEKTSEAIFAVTNHKIVNGDIC